MTRDPKIAAYVAAYVKERNEMLISGDPDRLVAFMKKHNLPFSSRREVAELTLHKARTAEVSLPMKYRIESKKWLTAHNSPSMDAGDIPDE